MFQSIITALIAGTSLLIAPPSTATAQREHSFSLTVRQPFQPAEFYGVRNHRPRVIRTNSKKLNRPEWQQLYHLWAVIAPHQPVAALRRLQVDSTSYCQLGTTASGQSTHSGIAAMNTLPLGTRVRVVTGPLAGTTLTVLDHIDYGSQFDIWQASCTKALDYGRRQITIEVVT